MQPTLMHSNWIMESPFYLTIKVRIFSWKPWRSILKGWNRHMIWGQLINKHLSFTTIQNSITQRILSSNSIWTDIVLFYCLNSINHWWSSITSNCWSSVATRANSPSIILKSFTKDCLPNCIIVSRHSLSLWSLAILLLLIAYIWSSVWHRSR